jgi:SAM-dependent methyltransferase
MAEQNASDSVKVDASPRAQRMRFAAFAALEAAVALEGTTILDVGCGLGDLWAYLKTLGVRCEYVGVDVSEAMVVQARSKFPDATFETRDILEWDPGRRFDYVVAIGIHNVRIPGVEPLLERMTKRQFELCSRAAHVSLLTDRYPAFGPKALSWRAEDVLSMALGITANVALRHDYLPNDFSVTLYREPLIDRRGELLIGIE